MPIRDLDPQAAHAEMQQSPGHVFLDVRSVEEYDAGHPAGALNVPVLLRDPASGGMSPNPGFVAAVQQRVPKTTRIYASCLGGVRSLTALRALEASGYTDLVNVASGWGGKKDPMGRIVMPGWKDCGLPVSAEKSTWGR